MTIKEIAELADVSSAAVSRYLNGGYISEEKRKRIAQVIQETGYAPSSQARALRTKKARLVGVVVPKINSESISNVTAGVSRVLSRRGYQMLLADADNNPRRELEYLELFSAYPVDGIILAGTIMSKRHRALFKRLRVPIVVVGQKIDGMSCVYHDDYGASRELGARVARTMPAGAHVAYIGVTREDAAVGAAREDGMIDGLRSAGADIDERTIRRCAPSSDAGYTQALDLLDLNDDLRLIACATDIMAAGVFKALRERGFNRGEDVPLVSGFGDNRLIADLTGGIPTVRLSHLTSGVKGAEILIDAIESAQTVPIQVKLGFEIRLPS